MSLVEFRKTGGRVRILRNLQIDDVSSVDVGAGRGVRVVLAKRDGAEPDDGGKVSFPPLIIGAIMKIAKGGSGRLPPTKPVNELVQSGELNAASPGDQNFVLRASEILVRAAQAKMKLDPKLTWPSAVVQAAMDAEFLAEARIKNPFVNKVSIRREAGGGKKETVSMGKSLRCPHCGKEADADAFAKAAEAGEQVIGKAQQVVFDDIVKNLIGDGMSRKEAVAAIGKGGTAGTSNYELEKRLTEAHRQERMLRLGF
jgi:hypothetical protein